MKGLLISPNLTESSEKLSKPKARYDGEWNEHNKQMQWNRMQRKERRNDLKIEQERYAD